MGATRAARRTDPADQLSTTDLLAFTDQVFRLMSIQGVDTPAVVDHGGIAMQKQTALEDNLAWSGGVDIAPQ